MSDASALVEEPVEIAVRRLRHGQPPLGREGARARRRARDREPRPRRGCAPPPASSCPASARSRARWTTCASWGSTSCCASALTRARRCSASASACSSRSSPRPSSAEPPASASCPARSARCDAGELKLPHIGWNEVRFASPDSPLVDGSARAAAPSTTCTRFAPVPADEQRRPRHGRVRRAVRHRGAARLLLRRAVPPREVLRRRPAPARQLRAHLRRRRGAASRGEALPGDRHPRRQRRAPRQGRLRREEGLRRGPAVRRARLGATRAREYLHVVDLDGAKPGEPVNLEHLRRIAAERGRAGAVRRRAAHRRGGRGRARRGRRARDPRHRRVHRPAICSARRSTRMAPSGSSSRSTCAAATSPRTAGSRRTDMPARDAFAALRARGVRHFVFTNVDHDGMLDGAEPRGGRVAWRRRWAMAA